LLVARAQAGDRGSFETLVRHNADRLYAVVLRFSVSDADAEEATQEAFVRAWRSIERFRGESRFFTWLYRIGVNEAKRIAERGPEAGTVVSVEERPVDDISDEQPGPEATRRAVRASRGTRAGGSSAAREVPGCGGAA
jgi:RNA polymerase sigma-70 factor (ECF subfamily)